MKAPEKGAFFAFAYTAMVARFRTLMILSVFFGLSATAATSGFDVNDVSILFPLHEDQSAAHPDVSLSFQTQSGPLLSGGLFQEVQRKTEAISENRHRLGYSRWRIVALRYEPCSPLSFQGLECQAEFRLVTQPLSPSGGFDDFAMHLIYRVEPSQQDEVIKSLVEIRDLSLQINAVTRGKTLQPHPGLSLEMQNGGSALQEKIQQMISRFGGESKLSDLTSVDADPQMSGPWFFIGGKIKNAKWEIEKIPLLGNSEFQAVDDMGLTDQLPQSGMATFLKGFIGRSLRKAPLTQKEIESLYLVQNPLLSHAKNTDCASCHMSGIKTVNYSTASSQQVQAFQMPLGVTGFADHRFYPERESNTRIFGYFLDQATVTPIVANSSAKVASQINQKMGWLAPTQKDCRSSEVRDCFLKLGKWQSQGGTEKVCLALCGN